MFLTSVVAYSGLLAGIIVAYLSREELRLGQKYFYLAQAAILSSIAVVTVYLHFNWWLALLVGIAVIYPMLWACNPSLSIYIYPALGLILFWNSLTPDAIALTAGLIFLYGLPTAAVQLIRGWRYPILYNSGFLAVSLLVLLL